MMPELILTIIFITYGLVLLLNFGAILTWVERKQAAIMADRIGANRCYVRLPFTNKKIIAWGLFHAMADGLKMLLKENFKPNAYDKFIYWLAPWLVFTPVLLVFAVIPFGGTLTPSKIHPIFFEWFGNKSYPMQIAPLDAGILVIFAITGFSVIGTILAGWSSNNKFSLLGSLRAASQMISYELSLGLSLIGIILIYGTFDLNAMVQNQTGLLFDFLPAWGIFLQPFAALLFLTAAIAENKRIPFDLPEAESELIAGYFTEFSAMKMGLFMFAEFIEIAIISAIFTTVFLGGYNLPYMNDTGIFIPGFKPLIFSHFIMILIQMTVFLIKVFLLCSFQILIRWTLPRFRYDQLLNFGWKFLFPLSAFNLIVTVFILYFIKGSGT